MTPIDLLRKFNFCSVHSPNSKDDVYYKDGIKVSIGYFDTTVQLFDGSIFFRGMFESEEQVIEILSNALRKADSLNIQLKTEAEMKEKGIKKRAATS